MTSQVQMTNGALWHTTLSPDAVIEFAHHGRPWIVLPLVSESHGRPDDQGLTAIISGQHISSVRAMA